MKALEGLTMEKNLFDNIGSEKKRFINKKSAKINSLIFN